MLEKRSVSLAGHRTSVALEPEFWRELDRIANEADQSLASLVSDVDQARSPETNLASALRLAVLSALTRRSGTPLS
ncbi:MAG: ribbon-helix-helix domain-containing protein [Pseudomonadota bacterium]